MGRGKLSTEEILVLKKNPYVVDVIGNRVIYADEFKTLFLKQYFNGKKPTDIFIDAGFDVSVLGTKRIERASARWRETNAAGNMGEKYINNDFYQKNSKSRKELYTIINRQNKEIANLNRELKKYKSLCLKEEEK